MEWTRYHSKWFGSTITEGSLEKSVVKMILRIANSDRERECLKYAIFKSSGMTPSGIRRTHGFENIEQAISRIQQIHKAIAQLASIQDKGLLQSFNFVGIESS